MRRLVVVGAAFLLIGFVLGWLCHRLPPRTAPPWSTAVQLAESEAALQACQAELATCRARRSRPLPATGLTDCYTETQEKAPCQSTDRPGQDAFYRAGCPTEGRFVDNGDDTVTDNCTGLMWQRRAPDISGNGSIGEFPEDAVVWQDALKYCENLSFAGHDDWRLPNVRELQSILDYGRFSPMIDPAFDAVGSVETFWSSSHYVGMPDRTWSVNFSIGFIDSTPQDARWYVRAVRGGLQ